MAEQRAGTGPPRRTARRSGGRAAAPMRGRCGRAPASRGRKRRPRPPAASEWRPRARRSSARAARRRTRPGRRPGAGAAPRARSPARGGRAGGRAAAREGSPARCRRPGSRATCAGRSGRAAPPGSGNVPSYSSGFSVASTMNGSGRRRVTPSTVTWRSAIASSSADCVFGIARLISSTRTMLAKTGPGRNSNSRDCWLKTESPVTSVGCRSGVHCTREWTTPSIEPARLRASTVFAVPGTSSNSTWPRHATAARTRRTCSVLPSTTCSTFASRRSATACARSRPDTGRILRGAANGTASAFPSHVAPCRRYNSGPWAKVAQCGAPRRNGRGRRRPSALRPPVPGSGCFSGRSASPSRTSPRVSAHSRTRR